MNIGIDAKRIFFNHSGLGNYGRRFYRALAGKLKDDSFFLYSPKAIPANNPYLSEIISRNSNVILPAGKAGRMLHGTLWRSRFIKKQLLKDKIGIYYGISNEIPFGLRRTDIIKVVIIHDLIFLRYPGMYPATDRAIYQLKTRYACKYADYIIAASEQTKQDVISYYKVPESKISVLFPASDPSFYADKCADSTEFFSTGRKYIISIGAITPRKNLFKTVQAYHSIKDKYNLDLVVIGTATGLGKPYLETIMKFILENGMKDRVHFLGNVPYKFVPDLCRKAELMVYPSSFEGFGMPIIEGLFSRIPVITSQGGCFPEAGGDAAIYINPEDPCEIADAISQVMDSGSMRNEMIMKGLEHAKKFTYEQIETSILEFHRKITAKA
jgi:glycosyltransferase involved in cell wall biosynthesis